MLMPGHNWLASLKPVEEASARRVAESGVFKAVKVEDLVAEAQCLLSSGELQLRQGWLDLFEMFLPSSDPPNGSKLSILSVNWSEEWIRWTLYLAASVVSHVRKQELLDLINEMEIFSNQIHGLASPQGSSGRLVGGVNGPIRTSADKKRYLQLLHSKLNTEHTNPTPTNSKTEAVVVYVGDSSTDFDCLFAADVGVWVADVPESQYKAEFAETFRPLDYVPPSIRAIKAMDSSQWCAWATDLEEVANAMERLDRKSVERKTNLSERETEHQGVTTN